MESAIVCERGRRTSRRHPPRRGFEVEPQKLLGNRSARLVSVGKRANADDNVHRLRDESYEERDKWGRCSFRRACWAARAVKTARFRLVGSSGRRGGVAARGGRSGETLAGPRG